MRRVSNKHIYLYPMTISNCQLDEIVFVKWKVRFCDAYRGLFLMENRTCEVKSRGEIKKRRTAQLPTSHRLYIEQEIHRYLFFLETIYVITERPLSSEWMQRLLAIITSASHRPIITVNNSAMEAFEADEDDSWMGLKQIKPLHEALPQSQLLILSHIDLTPHPTNRHHL